MTRRDVRLSEVFLARASEVYPAGGSAEGQPSLEVFNREVLPIAIRAFGDSWEQLSFDAIQSVRFLLIAMPPFFGAIVFFGVLVDDHVELVDIEDDPEYWDD